VLDTESFQVRARHSATIASIVVFVLVGGLAYWQVFRTDLETNQFNPRVIAAYNDPGRGRILDRDGNVLVETLPGAQRVYRDPSLAHVLGYLSPRFGSQGVELAFNDYLAGQRGGSWQAAFAAEFDRQSRTGLDVRLTIDPVVQSAANVALAGRPGAVIALDPRNGEVLAMTSAPAYDPAQVETQGEVLFNDPTSPVLNRATQGRYPPGSTFKTVVAAAALDLGVIEPDTLVTCEDEVVIDGFPISCRNVPQGEGTYPFSDAYAYSVNAIFAEVGSMVGWLGLRDVAARWGFGEAPEFALETAPSQLFAPGTDQSEVLLATTSFGQGELLVTPLQMALVAATVANGGEMATPRIGLEALDDGSPASAIDGSESRRVISERVANELAQMMADVVEFGQAAGVQLPGISVAGKTGTAETGTGTSHAWFIAFAPVEDPQIAVAVIVEDGGQGSTIASPIAGQVIAAAVAP
jgi:penicillin-binding protein A